MKFLDTKPHSKGVCARYKNRKKGEVFSSFFCAQKRDNCPQ